jgi:hypothetical protein
MRSVHGLATIALFFIGSEVFAQPATTPPADRADRPGGTSTISPTPGPATSPALPSAQMPPATVQNREQAAASKAAKKSAKATKKKAKKSASATSSPPATTESTPPR